MPSFCRRPSISHVSWTLPVSERAGSSAAGQTLVPSPHAWSWRYWRVSSMWNVARLPHLTRRCSSMFSALGAWALRNGMCS